MERLCVVTCRLSAETPKILIATDETVKVVCTLPIDYTRGDCRLWREHSHKPFKVFTTASFSCTFYVTSKELLGTHQVGSRVYLKCDYHLQQYTSPFSDIRAVTVWDASQAVSSVDCKVSVDSDQPATFRDNSWASVSADGLMVRVNATNSQLMINETCSYILSHT
ncbi:hypothetical protein ABVT39_008247 [Epinephelus coioides]